MFTLANGIIISLLAIACIVVSFLICTESDMKLKQSIPLCAMATLLVVVLACVGIATYNTHTESGKRALKSWDSNKNGGMYRVVKVYDINGNEVQKYEGKFDVEEDTMDGVVKVKFDVNGKRHIVYSPTGTITIDEVDK